MLAFLLLIFALVANSFSAGSGLLNERAARRLPRGPPQRLGTTGRTRLPAQCREKAEGRARRTAIETGSVAALPTHFELPNES